MTGEAPPCARIPKSASQWGALMLDAIFIVAGIVFFLVTAAYADGCDRL